MEGEKRRILIVDWEQQEAETLAELLRKEGFFVRVCLQPRAALRHLRLKPFWLCIINSSLPGIDGVEYIRRMRRLRPMASVLILGRDLTYLQWDRFRAQGVELQLPKPVRPDLFLDVIRALARIGRSIAPVTQADEPGLIPTGPRLPQPCPRFKPPASA